MYIRMYGILYINSCMIHLCIIFSIHICMYTPALFFCELAIWTVVGVVTSTRDDVTIPAVVTVVLVVWAILLVVIVTLLVVIMVLLIVLQFVIVLIHSVDKYNKICTYIHMHFCMYVWYMAQRQCYTQLRFSVKWQVFFDTTSGWLITLMDSYMYMYVHTCAITFLSDLNFSFHFSLYYM